MSAIDEIIRAALVRLEERQRVIALELEERMRLVTETEAFPMVRSATAYAIAFGDMSRAISVEIRTIRIALEPVSPALVQRVESARCTCGIYIDSGETVCTMCAIEKA